MESVKEASTTEDFPIRELHPQFVVDATKTTIAVQLNIEEWHQVLDDLEDLADIRAFLAAKEEPGEYIPLEQALREIRANEVQ